MVTGQESRSRANTGDWVEVSARRGRPARWGVILEVLGGPGHERYRVRWDEAHESILYPTDGIRVVDAASMPAQGASFPAG
jgi:hypothetical protein